MRSATQLKLLRTDTRISNFPGVARDIISDSVPVKSDVNVTTKVEEALFDTEHNCVIARANPFTQVDSTKPTAATSYCDSDSAKVTFSDTSILPAANASDQNSTCRKRKQLSQYGKPAITSKENRSNLMKYLHRCQIRQQNVEDVVKCRLGAKSRISPGTELMLSNQMAVSLALPCLGL